MAFCYRIKNLPSEEYLYAASDELKKDTERRTVLTWTDLASSPEYVEDIRFWGFQADWEIIPSGIGVFIKNVQFKEYLYANDEVVTPNLRSVYTGKDFLSIGEKGIWKLQENQLDTL